MSEADFKVGWNRNFVQQYIMVGPVGSAATPWETDVTVSYRGYLVLQTVLCTDQSINILDICQY